MSFNKNTEQWIAKIAKRNRVKREDVLRYLKSLLSSRKVLSHLSFV